MIYDYYAYRILASGELKYERGRVSTEYNPAEALRQQGLEPIRLAPARYRFVWPWQQVKPAHLEQFWRSMSFLSGIPQHLAIDTFAERTQDRRLAQALRAVSTESVSGSFSGALAKRPEFPQLHVALAAAGDRVPVRRAEIYLGLAETLEFSHGVTLALRGPLMRAAVLAVVIALGLIWMAHGFVPAIESMLHAVSTTAALPPMTTATMRAVAFMGSPWSLIALGGVAAALIGLRIFLAANEEVGVAYERLVAKIPTWGKTTRQLETAVIARAFAATIRAESPDNAVELLIPVATRTNTRLALREVVNELRGRGEGGDLDIVGAFARTGAFDPIFTEYLAAGAMGTGIADACKEAARFLEAEGRTRISNLIQWVEPLLGGALITIFYGGFFALFWPFFTLAVTALHPPSSTYYIGH
ncbi:hypothetical protein EPN42_13070 [bacterium]|nr:MAG: hypothetical protein EPN42_13070 [bacterium]